MKFKYCIYIASYIVLTISLSFLIAYFAVTNSHRFPYVDNLIVNQVKKQYGCDINFGVFDMFGGSFKEFILNNNTPALLEDLYKDLDDESIEKLDIAINAILHVPDEKYSKYFLFNVNKYEKDFRAKLNTYRAETTLEQELPELKKKYKIHSKYFDDPRIPFIHGVFYDEHNLRFANDKIKNYIKNKIFIDGGAFVGDSLLVLLKYEPSKIYSFEISDWNIQRYNNTVKLNNVPKEKYEVVRKAIAESVGEHQIAGKWDMEGIISTEPIENGIKVLSTDIDTFMKERGGTVGFIKADVQGIMHKAVTGMKETIKKDRPVLLLDISDSPEDLFYTKPVLEKILKGLNYTIKITNFDSAHCITGTSIWAYPKELD